MFICLYLLLWLKTLKPRLFFMPINQDQFLGSNAKVCVTYSINANVSIIITSFQQKYVVLKVMRRSGGISKNLLINEVKPKVYVSFRISLYLDDTIFSHNTSIMFIIYLKKNIHFHFYNLFDLTISTGTLFDHIFLHFPML